MSFPNLFSPNTKIESAKMNENFQSGLRLTDRQDIAVNSVVSNQRAIFGWIFKQGTGSAAEMSQAVTFPFTFDSLPVVIPGGLGSLTGLDPTDISSFDTFSGTITASSIHAVPVSTTGFTMNWRNTSGNNYGATVRVGASWVAFGPKA